MNSIEYHEFDMQDLSLIEKYILFLLYLAGRLEVNSRLTNEELFDARLLIQKMLFFLAQDIKELKEELYFQPYKHGPYDETIANAVENLVEDGIIIYEKNDNNILLTITENGKKIAKQMESNSIIRKEDVNLIKKVIELFRNLDTDEILALLYYTFPEYAKYSDDKERIDKYRKKLALSLYKKGKVSIEKAAEIAGVPLIEFIDML